MAMARLSLGLRTHSKRKVQTTPEPIYRVQLNCSFRAVFSGQANLPGLVVVRLGHGECVRQWNSEHPHQKIEVGNAILEVNGISEPREMMKELQKAKSGNMLMTSELSAEQQKALDLGLRRHRQEQAVDGILKLFCPGDMEDEVSPCSICHDDMKESSLKDDALAQLPCGHQFHRRCVRKWIVSGKPCCPLCSQEHAVQTVWV